jgi:hypothetical protein
MSMSELTRRLSEVRRGEEHLKTRLPVESAYNTILRLADIVAYTSIPYPWIRRQFPEMYRMESVRVRGVNQTDKPANKTEIEERQRELSRFFHGWDLGTLVKAKVHGEWKIVNRYQNEVPLGTATRAQANARMINMTIDPKTLAIRINKGE